ncbi:hypothetical protein [Leucobacter insecticola]|uniref:hypothetical protein n=1 Tax=Leucobacter insecticola TaxID=2714934 RepID=UPI003CC6EDBD
MIVLVATAVFMLAWFFAPRHGLVVKALRKKARAVEGEGEPASGSESADIDIRELQKEVVV